MQPWPRIGGSGPAAGKSAVHKLGSNSHNHNGVRAWMLAELLSGAGLSKGFTIVVVGSTIVVGCGCIVGSSIVEVFIGSTWPKVIRTFHWSCKTGVSVTGALKRRSVSVATPPVKLSASMSGRHPLEVKDTGTRPPSFKVRINPHVGGLQVFNTHLWAPLLWPEPALYHRTTGQWNSLRHT